MYVHRPSFNGLKWYVLVTEKKSRMSETIEKIECTSREDAYRTYRYWMKQLGRGF